MELNCPNCTTHFSVPDDAIGPKGRKLKCAMCNHTWKQMPEGYVPEVEDSVPPPPPRRAASPPPPPEPEFDEPVPEPISFEDALADARSDFAAEREAEAAATAPMPMEMPPTGRARPDPLDGYGDDDIPMDSAPSKGRKDDDEDPLAGLDFGDLGGLDDPDDGFDSRSSAASRRDDLSASDLDDLLAAEPEPIPELFGRSSDSDDDDFDQENRRGGPLAGILLVLVVVMAGLGAGAWFGRSAIVEAFPQAEKAYAMLGIHIDEPDTGLLFKDVTSERLAQNGTDTLVVRGFIANVSAAPRRLPQLTLVLFDKTDAPIQRAIVDPPQPNLEPGNTTGFRIQLENPSLLAQRFEMNWVKPAPADEK